MALLNINSSNSPIHPTWLGFLLGLFGGVAVSSVVVGLVVGYSFGGIHGGGVQAPAVADNGAPTPAAPTPSAPAAPSTPPAAITARDHVRGNPDAKVSVIVYSDFECPFCKRHAPTLAQILTTYKNDVNLVYRHFPLSFHANAHKEAEASECVAELGGNDAFWKYYDYVFDKTTSNGTGFPLDQLPVAAKQAGVNVAKFQTCLDSGKYVKYVDDQENEGIAAGVQGTPGSFVLNNSTKAVETISGAVPFSTFQTSIDKMLKA